MAVAVALLVDQDQELGPGDACTAEEEGERSGRRVIMAGLARRRAQELRAART